MNDDLLDWIKTKSMSSLKVHFAKYFIKKDIKREMNSLEIKEKLGKGAFGEVFRAIDKKTGKVYALKKIIKLDKETEKEVNREAQVQATLHHPNIIK